MTLRGGSRSLAARLRKLEQRTPEPQGPVEYRVYFHDGTPAAALTPRCSDGGTYEGGPELVYRIASWEETELGAVTRRVGRRP